MRYGDDRVDSIPMLLIIEKREEFPPIRKSENQTLDL